MQFNVLEMSFTAFLATNPDASTQDVQRHLKAVITANPARLADAVELLADFLTPGRWAPAVQSQHLTVYIADGPDGAKEIFIDEDGPDSGESGTRFKTLEGATACIRTWVSDQVRESIFEEEQKMAVLRENLDTAFAGLKLLQERVNRDDESHPDEQL